MEDKTGRDEEKTYPEYRRSKGRRRPKWEEEQGTLMDRKEESFEKHLRRFMEDTSQRKEEETYPEYRRSKTSIQRRPDWRKEQGTLMNRKEEVNYTSYFVLRFK
ncbi:uncharacterized protein LOC123524879 [Mercenaria mercenaria]|uniref:uncharacterized protein LOC123524879 n=1 Tax=Mercenaria mercenaria TaxID=6596 RepID=UPI001E1D93C7|nr:uncharacterized protein LOC123524879 [Mercenaria mercenaria]